MMKRKLLLLGRDEDELQAEEEHGLDRSVLCVCVGGWVGGWVCAVVMRDTFRQMYYVLLPMCYRVKVSC